MKLIETPIPGVCVIEPERIVDARGWFARTFDAAVFAAHGLSGAVVQANSSFNAKRGTLRGMHLQLAPHGEPKLVRCVRGSVLDVVVDLRPESATYCGWHAVELSAENGLGLYIPVGVAHGFQTLIDETEVTYLMGHEFVPASASGVRWNDPRFGIVWPEAPEGRTISEKDNAYPDLEP